MKLRPSRKDAYIEKKSRCPEEGEGGEELLDERLLRANYCSTYKKLFDHRMKKVKEKGQVASLELFFNTWNVKRGLGERGLFQCRVRRAVKECSLVGGRWKKGDPV